MRNTIFYILILIPFSLFSKNIPDLAILGLMNIDLHKEYLAEIVIPSKYENKIIEYGNNDFGFLSTKVKNGVIKIVPPYYEEEVNFFIDSKKIISKKFMDKNPKWIKEDFNIKLKGEFKTKFFLTPLSVIRKGKRLVLLAVINKKGQVVWAYLLNKGRVSSGDSYPLMKLIDNEIYIINRFKTHMGGKKKVALEVIKFKEGASFVRDVTRFKPHHDFLIKNNKMIFLRKKKKKIRTTRLNVFKWEGDAIYEWDLNREKVAERWDSFDVVFPMEAIYYDKVRDKKKDEVNQHLEKRVIHRARLPHEKKNKPLKKDPKDILRKMLLMHKPVDFTHANSLFLKKNGDMIVSIRNLNKVLILDNDYKVKKEFLGDNLGFYHQHHVSEIFLNNNSYYLMFNNGDRAPSAPEIRDENFNLVKRFSIDKNEKELYSPIRSSADLIDGQVVSLFSEGPKSPNSIVEFSLTTEKETGRITINENKRKTQQIYRIIPFNDFE